MKTVLFIIGCVLLYLLIGSTVYFIISAIEHDKYDQDDHFGMMVFWVFLLPLIILMNITEIYRKLWELTVALFVMLFKKEKRGEDE